MSVDESALTVFNILFIIHSFMTHGDSQNVNKIVDFLRKRGIFFIFEKFFHFCLQDCILFHSFFCKKLVISEL